jgi:predicted MFS family arabinose efflux permease
MNFTLACSLLSKITPTKSAAFYQSLGFATINLAIIIARPLAGATFDKIPMMYNCLGLAIAWAFGVIWIAVEYKNFPPKPSFDK